MPQIKTNCSINKFHNKEFIINLEQDDKEYITRDEIKSELYKKLIDNEEFLEKADLFGLEQEDIIITHIRYFDDDIKGWILLETEYIPLYNKEIIKLLIKLNIKTTQQKNLINKYVQMKKTLEDISNSIKNNKNEQNNNEKKYIDSEVDISVLISNPLMLKKVEEDNKEKLYELKTINDFHNVVSSIFNAIRSSTKLVTAEFYPLSEESLIEVISHKPKIIHLICKSVYILPEKIGNKDESSNFAKLIFEYNNSCLARIIHKDNLDYIFDIDKFKEKEIVEENEIKEGQKRKELIKDIVLIISTPLSEDVYKLVKDYGFKNVLIQHTTIANSEYISDFNTDFYKNIIEQSNLNDYNLDQDENKINEFFENSIKKNELLISSCCCYHRHKPKCPLMKNLYNEIFKNNNLNKEENCENNKEKRSHFFHLRYKCYCNNDSFLEHTFCINKKEKLNVCCLCKNDKDKKKEHSLNNIFSKDFEKDKKNNEIKLGCGLNNSGVIKNIEILPDYENMKLMVGRNKLIYDIYKKLLDLKEKNKLIIVYKNNMASYYELNELADNLIGYLKERIYYCNEDNNINNNKNNDSLQLLKKDKTFNISNPINFSDNIKLDLNKNKEYKSAPINFEFKNDFNFVKMTVRNNDFKIPRTKFKGKINFFFIFIIDENLLIDSIIKTIFKDLLQGQNIRKNSIVLFTNKEINQKIHLQNYSFEKYKLPNIDKEEYKIKYQMEKVKKEKLEFDYYINQIELENRIININNITINKDTSILYELLFLFKCFSKKIYESQIKKIYQGSINTINEQIEINFKKFNRKIENEINNFVDDVKILNQKQNDIKRILDKIIDNLIDELYLIKKIITDNRIYYLEKKKDEFDVIRNLIENNINKIDETIKEKINLIKETIINLNGKENEKENKEIEKEYDNLRDIVEKNIKAIRGDFNEVIEKELCTVKETIQTLEEDLKIILNKKVVIDTYSNQTDIEFIKINRNKNFDIYYNNWENKITDEIKGNVLIKLFKFYSKIFDFFIKKEEKYDPYKVTNVFLNSYSTMNQINNWLKLDKKEIKKNLITSLLKKKISKEKLLLNDYFAKWYEKNEKNRKITRNKNLNPKDKTEQLTDYIKTFTSKYLHEYFQKFVGNFHETFTEENIDLCLNNPEISNTIKYYIDDISFSYFSCLKIFDMIDMKESKRKRKVFEDYFKETQNDFLYTRLILTNWMYNYNIKELDKVDYILNETEGNLCKEEEIEKKFNESVIYIKENRNNLHLGRILSDIKENKEEEKIEEKSFINIFKSKIKYIKCKYKIKNGIYNEKDLEELKDNKENKLKDEKEDKSKNEKENKLKDDKENKCLASIFKEEKCHLSEIKVYLCIAEWYCEKYEKGGDINDQKNYIGYLNFAFYVANLYYKQNNNEYIYKENKEYISYLAETKYKKIKKDEDSQAYNDAISKIQILCNLYNYEFTDNNIDYYYVKNINNISSRP